MRIIAFFALIAATSLSFGLKAQELRYGAAISLEKTKLVVARAEAEAARNNWFIIVTVVDSGGHIVVVHRMDGAQYGSIELAERKALTALNFKRPTKDLEGVVAQGGIGATYLTIPNAALIRGGVPIVVDNKIVGAIGISGASPAQDEQVALAAIADLK